MSRTVYLFRVPNEGREAGKGSRAHVATDGLQVLRSYKGEPRKAFLSRCSEAWGPELTIIRLKRKKK